MGSNSNNREHDEEKERKALKYRNYIVQEIIQFEKKFVEDLSAFHDNVVGPLLTWFDEVEYQAEENIKPYGRKILPLPQEEIGQIKLLFKAMESYVLPFAEKIDSELTELYSSSSVKKYFDGDKQTLNLREAKETCRIGPFFKEVVPFFGMYAPYILKYDDALERIVSLREHRADFHFILRACELQKHNDNYIEDIQRYLILPIQHIPRTALLLEDLLKHTNPDADEDYAILKEAKLSVEEILIRMNEKLKIAEDRHKVVKFAEQFQDTAANRRRFADVLKKRRKKEPQEAEEESQQEYKCNWIEPHRLYIKDGFLRKMCRKGLQKYFFVLFNDKLIYGKESLSLGALGAREFDCHREFDLDSLLIINLGNLDAIDGEEEKEKRRSNPLSGKEGYNNRNSSGSLRISQSNRESNQHNQSSNNDDNSNSKNITEIGEKNLPLLPPITPPSVTSSSNTLSSSSFSAMKNMDSNLVNSDNVSISKNMPTTTSPTDFLFSGLGQDYNRSFIIVHYPEDLGEDHKKAFIVSCKSMDEKRGWISALNTSFINFSKMNGDKKKKSNVFTFPDNYFDAQQPQQQSPPPPQKQEQEQRQQQNAECDFDPFSPLTNVSSSASYLDGFISPKEILTICNLQLYLEDYQQVECEINLDINFLHRQQQQQQPQRRRQQLENVLNNIVPLEAVSLAEYKKKEYNYGILLEQNLRIKQGQEEVTRQSHRRRSSLVSFFSRRKNSRTNNKSSNDDEDYSSLSSFSSPSPSSSSSSTTPLDINTSTSFSSMESSRQQTKRCSFNDNENTNNSNSTVDLISFPSMEEKENPQSASGLASEKCNSNHHTNVNNNNNINDNDDNDNNNYNKTSTSEKQPKLDDLLSTSVDKEKQQQQQGIHPFILFISTSIYLYLSIYLYISISIYITIL